MYVLLEFAENFIYVRYVGTDPNIHVDGGAFVYPNGKFEQYTYEELRELGPGKLDLPKAKKSSKPKSKGNGEITHNG